MTEDEARGWIADRHGRQAVETMGRIVSLVTAESGRQNLVSPSTLEKIWARHIVDSAQLLDLAGAVDPTSDWIDIGSGAGFPGLVIAALTECHVTLVEPRKRRAGFLQEAIETLGLTNATLTCNRMQALRVRASVISARAVAPLGTLLEWGSACAGVSTRWILPKGRSAREEVATARQAWHGMFHVEQSITDPESLIVVASGVARR